MKADRGLTVARMVELGGVSRASFYRYDEDAAPRMDRDMDLRDAIQRREDKHRVSPVNAQRRRG